LGIQDGLLGVRVAKLRFRAEPVKNRDISITILAFGARDAMAEVVNMKLSIGILV
jgi:hypothetical protein